MFLYLTSPAHSTHSLPRALHDGLCGRLADQNTFTGYEPKDLIEVNDTEVTPTLFHRPSMTSTYDSAQSVATPPLEADLDDEQIKAMLASPLYRQERERSKCRPTTSLPPTEKTQCQVRVVRSESETTFLEEQRNHWLLLAKAEMLKQECRADFADRSIRELQRQIQSNHMEIDRPNLGYEQLRREQARLHEELPQRERALREIHI